MEEILCHMQQDIPTYGGDVKYDSYCKQSRCCSI